MKRVALLSLLLLAVDATPVLKRVMSMLESMKESSEKEKHEEEKQFAAYDAWCTSELATKRRELGEASDACALLAAEAEASASASAEAEARRQALAVELRKWQRQKENATVTRRREAEVYKETHESYTESIAAIMKASRALKMKAKEPKSLLSIDRKLAVFLSLHAPLDALDFSSDRIGDMLNELRDRFTDERSKLEKEEMRLHHAHELQVQQLSALISQGETEASEVTRRFAGHREAVGQQRARLADASAAQKELGDYVQQVNVSCGSKAVAFAERQAVRESELSALGKATELLKAEAVGRSEGRLGLVQGTALVALRGDAQLRAAELLQQQGAKLNSRVLLSMATRLSGDPMANVRKMLTTLITTLETESSQEMEHRDWCDTELKGNKAAREQKEKRLELTQTELEGLESAVAELGLAVAELQRQLAEDAEAHETQAAQREAEEKENEKTLEDAKSAQEAVSKAIEVLRDVYSGSGSFIERSSGRLAAAPEIFQGAYSPQGGSGLIAMLEVVHSDYAKLESTTEAQESKAKKDFERLSSELQVLKVSQEKDLEHKKASKLEKEQLIVGKKSDLQDAEKELAAAEKYREELKDSCLASGSTAQERLQRRREEVESLKEAMELLEGGQ